MSPLIGITTYRERASWGTWTQSADLLPTPYAVAIESAHGIPVLLPPPSSPPPLRAERNRRRGPT